MISSGKRNTILPMFRLLHNRNESLCGTLNAWLVWKHKWKSTYCNGSKNTCCFLLWGNFETDWTHAVQPPLGSILDNEEVLKEKLQFRRTELRRTVQWCFYKAAGTKTHITSFHMHSNHAIITVYHYTEHWLSGCTSDFKIISNSYLKSVKLNLNHLLSVL